MTRLLHRKICFLRTFLSLACLSVCYFLGSIYILYAHNRFIPSPDVVPPDPLVPGYLTCYYAEDTRNITVITNSPTPKPENSIFFHETNCQLTLHLREACSVESAARSHPNRQVFVVLSSAVQELELEWKSGVLAVLATIPNVHFYKINLNTYADGTPLQYIFSPGLTWLGKWHYRKIGELLKFLTLYKFGGTVIDLDMMVVGGMDMLGQNWASTSADSESGIISVSRGQSWKLYTQEFLNSLKHQMATEGGTNTESALKAAFKILCNTTDKVKVTRNKCKGFRVYSNEFYNPGHRWNDTVAAANITKKYLGYHLWDETRGHYRRTNIPTNSLYVSLAKRHCPLIFNMFMSTQVAPLVHL